MLPRGLSDTSGREEESVFFIDVVSTRAFPEWKEPVRDGVAHHALNFAYQLRSYGFAPGLGVENGKIEESGGWRLLRRHHHGQCES